MPLIKYEYLTEHGMMTRYADQPEPIPWRVQAERSFLGDSAVMQQARNELRCAAQTDLPVLLVGETGTGKGVAARLVHWWSGRDAGPFVELRLGALDRANAHSELYGHQPGGFPGAGSERIGTVEQAKRGTLFLDDLDRALPEVQRFLIPILKDGMYEERGTHRWQPLDARLVAAARGDLGQAVREGRCRDDLYSALCWVVVRLPALREHFEDIPLLVNNLLGGSVTRYKIRPTTIAPAAMDLLMAHDWPGNVRELEYAVAMAAASAAGDPIQPENIQLHRTRSREAGGSIRQWPTLAEHERQYLAEVLEHTHGVVKGPHGAARLLQVPVSTLRDRMRKLGVQPVGAQTCPSP